jgi:hypothetical protein
MPLSYKSSMYKIVEASGAITKACDTLSHVTLSQAAALRGDGFEAMGLYADIVTAEDLAVVTGAGMGVWFFLEGLASTTTPTAELGSRQATNGVRRMRALGVPAGATYITDLEGSGPAQTPKAWIEYGNASAKAVQALGDISGGYFGAGQGLTSKEMFAMAFIRYAKGCSQIKDRFGEFAEPACGWCVVQAFPDNFDHKSGLQIDGDALWQDFYRRAITLVVAS